jgi:hypothetical protein
MRPVLTDTRTFSPATVYLHSIAEDFLQNSNRSKKVRYNRLNVIEWIRVMPEKAILQAQTLNTIQRDDSRNKEYMNKINYIVLPAHKKIGGMR